MTWCWCAYCARIQSIKSSKPVLMCSRMDWICIVALPGNTQKPLQNLNDHSLLPLIRKDLGFLELTLQRGATRSNFAVGPSIEAVLPRFSSLKAEMVATVTNHRSFTGFCTVEKPLLKLLSSWMRSRRFKCKMRCTSQNLPQYRS